MEAQKWNRPGAKRKHPPIPNATTENSGATSDLEGLPGWDTSVMLIDERMLASLREDDDDDGQFFRELIEAYIEHAESLRHKLESAHRKKDDAAFQAAVHNLKGGSLNIGAFNLGTLCRAMDQAHQKGQTALVSRGMKAFPDVFARSMAALLDLLGNA